jgi:hypothetical protein
MSQNRFGSLPRRLARHAEALAKAGHVVALAGMEGLVKAVPFLPFASTLQRLDDLTAPDLSPLGLVNDQLFVIL